MSALRAFPGGLHVGGGVTPENAGQYLDAGASHVIVTSYVFRNGRLEEDRLNALVRSGFRRKGVAECARDDVPVAWPAAASILRLVGANMP